MVSLWPSGRCVGVQPTSVALLGQVPDKSRLGVLHVDRAERGEQILPTLSTQLREQWRRVVSLARERVSAGHLPHAQDTNEDQT